MLEFSTPELQYPERLNAAAELIDVAVARFGADRPALRTPAGDVWSYGELQRRANQVAQVLVEDLGMAPGNRVLLRSPNNPWTVAAWLGVLKAGGIAATTFSALRGRELVPIVSKAKPTIALVDHRFVADVEELREVAPDLRIVAFGGDGADDLVGPSATKSGVFQAVETAADDVALFCPTSGSTGVPKITTHFHRDILSIDNTFGRHILRCRPTTSWRARLRSPSPSGSACSSSSRCEPARARWSPRRRRRTSWPRSSRGTASPCWRPRQRRTSRSWLSARALPLAGLRAAVSAGEHIPQRDLGAAA